MRHLLFPACAILLALPVPSAAATAKLEVVCGVEVGAYRLKALALEVRGGSKGEAVNKIVERDDAIDIAATLDSEAADIPAETVEKAVARIKAIYDLAGQRAGRERCKVYLASSISATATGRLIRDRLVAERIRVEMVSPTQEALASWRINVAPVNYDRSVLVDVGSGTTKIAYMSAAKHEFVATEVRVGTRTLLGENPSAVDAADAVRRRVDNDLMPQLAASEKLRNGLGSRRRVYWLGGIAWAVALRIHPERANRLYAEMSVDELKKAWNDIAANGGKALRKLSVVEDADALFNRSEMLAGLGLMNGILSLAPTDISVRVPMRKKSWLYGQLLSSGSPSPPSVRE